MTQYIGRFAPSPSGPLHFGSLVTALGSYLQAKKQNGRWLLRIEDIDPPREIKGATEDILRCLEAHQLFWDGEVTYQSHRSELYEEKIRWLKEQGFSYHCQCTRSQFSSLSAGCLCPCHDKLLPNHNNAIRFKHLSPILEFKDNLLGLQTFAQGSLRAHFAIKRKDGLYAYQLAVVVDDIQQGITEVARGADLLDATVFQLALFNALRQPPPAFLHFPLVVTQPGKKLSKQNHATAIDPRFANVNLCHALAFFGLSVPVVNQSDTPENLLDWALEHWDINNVPAKTECIDNRIGEQESI